MREWAGSLADFVAVRSEVSVSQVGWSAGVSRADLVDRAVVVASGRGELVEGLRALAAGNQHPCVLEPTHVTSQPRVALTIGTGQPILGVLQGIYGPDSGVTEFVDQIAEATDFPVALLIDEPSAHAGSDLDSATRQLGEYVASVALGLWWRARGMEPELIVGGGMGVFAAAALAGVYAPIDGAKIVQALVDASGSDPSDLSELAASIAWEPALLDVLNADGKIVDTAALSSPQKWADIAQSAVTATDSSEELAGAAAELVSRGIDAVIDLGRGAWLSSLDVHGYTGLRTATIDPGNQHEAMARAIGQLWCAGGAINWQAVNPRHDSHLVLPSYAFQRQRYWLDNATGSTPMVARPLDPRFVSLATGGLVAETTISVASLPFLSEHMVHDQYVVPGVVFIELVLRAGAELLGGDVTIESLQIKRPLVLHPEAVADVQVSVERGGSGHRASVYSRAADGTWHVHLVAEIAQRDGSVDPVGEPGFTITEPADTSSLPAFDATNFYTQFWHPNFRLGTSFQLIDRARGGSGWAQATFVMPGAETRGVSAGIRPELLLLDTAVQLVALAAHEPGKLDPERPVRLGTGYRRMGVGTSVPQGPILAAATAVSTPDGQIIGDVTLTGGDGTVLAFLEGVSFAQVSPAMLARMAEAVHSADTQRAPLTEIDLTALTALPRGERVTQIDGALRTALARITKNDPASFDGAESLIERLDSLMLIELKDIVEQQFAVEISTETLFDASSLVGLSNWVADEITTQGGSSDDAAQAETTSVAAASPAATTEGAAPATATTEGAAPAPPRPQRRRRSRLMSVEQMTEKAFLDPSIVGKGAPDPDAPAATLLTGATGFVGAFLLRELLRSTDGDVLCLVRANNEAHGTERLEANLAKYGIDLDADDARGYRDRIIPLVGDLGEPRFGLSEESFTGLHAMIGRILHCGGMVKWTYPYDGLAAANVAGTVEVLKLATIGAPRQVDFISTVGVFSSRTYTEPSVTEDAELDTSGPLAVGYAQTKWVAEKLIRIAAERGVPTTIHRINTAGDSVSGAFNRQDHLSMMIKGCVEAGIAPIDAPMPLQPAPIDYVAAGIVALTREPSAVGGTFHLVHPQQLTWGQFFDHIGEYGYPYEGLTFADWREQVTSRRAGTMALVGLTPFLHESADDVRLPYSDSAQTREALSALGVHCPPLDSSLIHCYLDAFVASGFMPAPGES
ncbi:MAG: NAD-dependent epimerase/dehydratase family protein [Rhodococcus sp.]|nr:NAD-dependent epimerase/dehydratase family protein [Rhodococcus sp. (in: high G+C Gram-positive bacteria)]